MRRKPVLIIAVIIVVALAAGGGLVAWRLMSASGPPATATVQPTGPLPGTSPSPQPTPKPTSPLAGITPPPSLEELANRYPELADLLSSPGLSSTYKDFLVAFQEGGPEAARDLARQRGLLNSKDELRMVLVLDTEEPEPIVAQLEAAGIRVEDYYRDLVSIAVPLELIIRLAEAEDPGAALRQLGGLEHVIELRLPEASQPEAGQVEGEGVNLIGADEWHTAGYTGQGVKVAILDGGFKGYESLLGSELPDTVVYQSFAYDDATGEEASIHGTACAEVVHEIAPEAELYLVAYDEDVGFGKAVDWLIAEGVDVVSHSASWLADPRDGTGRRSLIVDQAEAAGIVWVNSAGNYADEHYAATLTDSDGDGWHEFEPGEEMLAFYPGATEEIDLVLNWDDWPRSNQDVDLYLVNEAGDTLASSVNIQDGTIRPVEIVTYQFSDSENYYLAFQAVSVTQAIHVDLLVTDGQVDGAVAAGSLGAPADALGAVAVGATYWANDEVESFSSRGPTADGRTKPEIAAPDGVAGTSYSRFFGTSAAAPHVAGAAALMLSAYPDASPAEIRGYLLERALDLGAAGMDNEYGAGRLDLGPVPMGESGELVTPTDTPTATPTPTLPPTEAPATAVPPPPTSLPPSPNPSPRPSPTPQPATGGGGTTVWLLAAIGAVAVAVAAAAFWLATRRQPRPRPGPAPQQARPPAGPAMQHARPRPGPAPQQAWPPAAPAAQQAWPPAAPASQQVRPLAAPAQHTGPRYCRQCGEPQRTTARFCGRCGSPLDMPVTRCPGCGREIVRTTAKFCGYCGHRL